MVSVCVKKNLYHQCAAIFSTTQKNLEGNLEGRTQTMPLAIYLGFERSLGIALVLSAMLLMVSIVLLAVLRHLENRTR